MEENARTTPPPPDGGWGWMVVLGYFGCMLVMVGIGKSFGMLIPELVVYFDTSVALVAGIMGAEGVIFTICTPFCLGFGQHYSQRVVVMFGGVVGGVGVSLCYFMFSIEYLILLFGVCTGIANACLFGNGLVIVGQYFYKRRSLATALALTGASVGHFVVPPIIQAVLDAFGIQGLFLVLGGFYLNIIVFGSLFRPLILLSRKQTSESEKQVLYSQNLEDIPRRFIRNDPVDFSQSHDTLHTIPETIKRPRLSLSTNDISADISKKMDVTKIKNRFAYLKDARNQVMGSLESLGQIVMSAEKLEPELEVNNIDNKKPRKKLVFPKVFHWSVFKMPEVIMFTVIMFLTFYGYYSFVIFMPPDAVSRGISKYEKTLLVSLSGIGDLIGRLIIAAVGDLGFMKRYKIMSLVCVFCGVNIILFDFATYYWWMATHVTLYGVFGGAYVAINAVVLFDLVGLETLPKALSTVILFQGLGGAIGQPIEGAIRDLTLSYHALNYMNGICLILGAMILYCHPLFLRCTKSPKKTSCTGSTDLPMIAITSEEGEDRKFISSED